MKISELGISFDNISLTAILEGLKPHDHLCLIYESREEWRAIVVPFIAIGLRKGEKCIYIVDTSTADEIRRYLTEEGINVTAVEKTGQLFILHQTEAYTREGSFDPDRMIALLIAETEKAVSEGYPSLRATGEMTWVLHGYPGSEKLLEYEAKINRDFFPKYPCLAICQYDRWKFNPELIKGVIMTHPLLVRGGQVYRNFYYIPTDQFLNAKRAELEAQHWLNNLERENLIQAALRESEARFRALFETMEQGVVYYNADGRITLANPAAERILGLTLDQMQGHTSINPFLQAIREDGSPFPSEEIPSMIALRTGKQVSNVVMGILHHPTENYRWILIDAIPEFVPGETRPFQVYTTFIDITDLRHADEILREERDKAQNYLDIGGVIFVAIDTEGKITLINKKGSDVLGYKEEEIIGENWFDRFIPPHIKDEMLSVFKKLISGQIEPVEHYENHLLTRSGEERLIAWHNTILRDNKGNIIGTLSSGEDITERKWAEEALRKSEAQLSIAMEIAKLGYWEYDLAEGLFIFNDHFYSIFHTSADQVGGYKMSPARYAELFLHPDDRHLVIDRTKEQPETPPPDFRFSDQFDHRIIYADGGIGYISVRSFAVADSDGRIVKVYGVNQDITERKHMEEALRKSQERMAAIRNSIPDVIMTLDEEGRYVDFISGEDELLYAEKKKIIGRLLSDVLPKDIADAGLATIQRALKTGKPQTIEYKLTVPAGERWFEGKISPVLSTDSREKLVVLVARDITERKRLEEEQQRVAKLESIGTLAGGIAHDFNNILTGIMGNISLAQRLVEPDSEIAERIEDAKKASLRARDLTHRLLTFARGGAPIKKTISIVEVIRDSANFAIRGSNVRCEYSLRDDLWPVEADEGQINQVFTNLVINAVEAMPMGGTINISARNHTIEKTDTLPINKVSYLEINVADHGTGISKEHLERIFDPYFTTKQRGSGLGLATSYSIVKNHDGHITVESELGVGTTFHVYLPASEKPAPAKEKTLIELPITGKGRILVMDDEKPIRLLLKRILEKAGYEVDLAGDGRETIQKYATTREAGTPFAAVIMDLTIPGGMGGKEAINKLLEIDPKVKAIVSSGYSTDPIMADYRTYGFIGVIAKPYHAGEVEKTLKNVLLDSE